MRRLLPWALPVLVLGLWELAGRSGFLPPSLAVEPTTIAANLTTELLRGSLALHLGYSLIRISVASLLATSLGVFVGVMLSHSTALDETVSPFLRYIAPIPVVAWMPFVVLFFGAGEAYKIVLGALAGFLIVQAHTYEAVRAIQKEYLEVAELLRLGSLARFRHVLVPGALPTVLVGVRLTLAIGWIVLFFVEYGSATQGSEGLGWYIADARALGRVEDEYSGVVLLGAAGFLTDTIVVRIQRWQGRWAGDAVEQLGYPP